ncbi:MAG: OsmC family protein [Sporolactobacillus sp.]
MSDLTFKRLLANRKIQYSDLTIETEPELAENEDPQRYIKVTIHFTLKGSDLDEKLIRRLFTHVYKNCTIAQSVKGAIEVDEQLDIVQTDRAAK